PGAGPETDILQEMRSPKPSRRRGGLIAAAVALLVVAGGAYGVWLNADAFKAMLGGDTTETVKVEPLVPAKPAPAVAATPPAVETTTAAAAPAADSGETPKFTQRLTPEGKEIDPGPAGGESSIGEGTSVVALTTQPPQPPLAAPATAET